MVLPPVDADRVAGRIDAAHYDAIAAAAALVSPDQISYQFRKLAFRALPIHSRIHWLPVLRVCDVVQRSV